MCTVTVDAAGSVVALTLSTRGVLDPGAGDAEIAGVEGAVRRAIAEAREGATDDDLGERARLAIRRTFHKNRGIKPVTIVHVRRGS
jgi:hypothetical protein